MPTNFINGQTLTGPALTAALAQSTTDALNGAVIGNLDLSANNIKIPAATGTLTLAAEAAYWPRAERFGVVADGVTDDTVALNRAFAAGVPLRMPPTAMRVTDQINVTTQNFRAWFPSRSSGGFAVSTDFNMSAFAVVYLQVPSVGAGIGTQAGPILENMRIHFDQPDSIIKSDYTAYPPAIYYQGTPRSRLVNPRIAGGWRGIVYDNNCGGMIVDNAELFCFSKHIEIDGSTDSLRFNSPHIWPFECTPNQIGVFMAPDTLGWDIGRADDYHISNGLTICGLSCNIRTGSKTGSLAGPSFGSWNSHDFDSFGGITVSDGVALFDSCAITLGPFSTPSGTRNPQFGMRKSGNARVMMSNCELLVAGLMSSGGAVITDTSATDGGCLTITGGEFNCGAFDQTFLAINGAKSLVTITGVSIIKTPNIAYTNAMLVFNAGCGTTSGCTFSPAGTGTSAAIAINGALKYAITGNVINGWSTVNSSGGTALFTGNVP